MDTLTDHQMFQVYPSLPYLSTPFKTKICYLTCVDITVILTPKDFVKDFVTADSTGLFAKKVYPSFPPVPKKLLSHLHHTLIHHFHLTFFTGLFDVTVKSEKQSKC